MPVKQFGGIPASRAVAAQVANTFWPASRIAFWTSAIGYGVSTIIYAGFVNRMNKAKCYLLFLA
jgi:hypothetical protein